MVGKRAQVSDSASVLSYSVSKRFPFGSELASKHASTLEVTGYGGPKPSPKGFESRLEGHDMTRICRVGVDRGVLSSYFALLAE
jgi:hypothetical protein